MCVCLYVCRHACVHTSSHNEFVGILCRNWELPTHHIWLFFSNSFKPISCCCFKSKQIKLKDNLSAHWVRTASTCLPFCFPEGVLYSIFLLVATFHIHTLHILLLLAQQMFDRRIYLMVLCCINFFLILSSVLHFPQQPTPLTYTSSFTLHCGPQMRPLEQELVFLHLLQWVSPMWYSFAEQIKAHTTCTGNISFCSSTTCTIWREIKCMSCSTF